MDNQGSNNFNNGQGITPQDANFWNPISPQGQPASQATQASQAPQPTQSSQAFGFASAPAAPVTPSATSTPGFNPQSFNQPASPYSPVDPTVSPQVSAMSQVVPSSIPANNASFMSQVTDPSGNLLNKDFNLMTDEEKKEAERIARAKNRVDLLKTIGVLLSFLYSQSSLSDSLSG